ncbi:MAG: hypothetical protein V4556_06745 [Bacteroidota bacterium]
MTLKYKLIFYSFIAYLLFTFSCKEHHPNRNIERSFYYWKSAFSLTDLEKNKLDSLGVKTIYLKFFDVVWDEQLHKALPVAPIKIVDSNFLITDSIAVIPTVFITNECLQKIDSADAKILGENIIGYIKTIIGKNNFYRIPEVQIDCDWTAETREKYFSVLKTIKSLKPNAMLSATIRLHQIKYLHKTGVPPVNRGLLMCYNMGNLKNPATKNSIIENEELKKYIGKLGNYPLPLDIALPLFEWNVLFRNNVYKGLMNDLSSDKLISISKVSGNRFEILQDTIFNGYELKKGDIIRNEKSDYKEIIAVAKSVNKELHNTGLKLSLFHLDSLTLSKYSTHELESIYNNMR